MTMNRPCMFSTGSTTKEGKSCAPERCRAAIFEKYQKMIESCEIMHAHECPLRAYFPIVERRCIEECASQSVPRS